MKYSWYSSLVNLHISVGEVAYSWWVVPKTRAPYKMGMEYGSCFMGKATLVTSIESWSITIQFDFPSSQSFKPLLGKLSRGFPKPWCLKWRTNHDNKLVNYLHLWQKLFVDIRLTKVECKMMSNNKSQKRQWFAWRHVTYNVTTMIMWMYVDQQNIRAIYM